MTRFPLFHALKRPIAVLALVALLIAQAAATIHATSHLRAGGDSKGLPGGSHVQLCLECASFAPLGSAQGNAVTALNVASLGVEEFLRPHDDSAVVRRQHLAFRSRAPPR
jgi:hypothetical protein